MSHLLRVCLLLTIINAVAQEQLPLTWENIFTKNHGARQAVLSPNGKYVAVVASTPENTGIFLINMDKPSASPRFLVAGSSPSWFADGQQFVYRAQGDLWKWSLNGSDPVRLTNDQQDERAPRPSPDGKWVAFYSGRSGNQDLWMVAADGNGQSIQLTEASMAVDDFRFAPSWSPDSKQLAYYSFKNDYWEDDIWVINVETKKERQVSSKLMAMSTPVWSPDGKTLAVMANAKAEYWYEDLSYIYLIDVEKGQDEKLEMQIHATDLLFNHTVT